jgi:hypothetical protein
MQGDSYSVLVRGLISLIRNHWLGINLHVFWTGPPAWHIRLYMVMHEELARFVPFWIEY